MSADLSYFDCPRPEIVRVVEPAGKRILELGCGTGAMGAGMLAAGAAEVVGVEVDARAATIARLKLDAVYRFDLNTLPRLPYAEGTFDCITCSDVLEHLVSPPAVLRHFGAYLAPGGRFVCSIPNVRHESVLIPLLLDGAWQYQDWGVLDRTHLRFFTRSGVAELVSDAGLAVDGPLFTVQSPPSCPEVPAIGELVSRLGGDGAALIDDATTLQFVFRARPLAQRRLAQPALPVARLWTGARAVRTVFVPAADAPAALWRAQVKALLSDVVLARGATVNVAVPPSTAGESAGVAWGGLDVREIATPAGEDAWARLLAGATVLVTTSGRPDLEAIAAQVGCEVLAVGEHVLRARAG